MISSIKSPILLAALLFCVNLSAKIVTENAAQSVAKSFMASQGLTEKEMVLYQSSDESTVFRTQSKDDAPAYHIFTGADHKGLIVVSGDDIARPILGYSFNITNDENGEMPPAMQEWLDDMERQILQARKAGLQQSAEVASQWKAPGIDAGNVVKQLTTAQWNQNPPLNQQCPSKNGVHCLTGCVPTAYAILMKFYRYPSSGKGGTPAYSCTKSGVNVPSRNLNHPYDWDSMLPEYFSNVDYSEHQADGVAQLMADIGAAIQADYGFDATSAYFDTHNKGAMFSHFGYNVGKQKFKADYTTEEWYSMLKDKLDNEHPVLYRAETEDQGGHAFIIDGYTDLDYFCINWGWGSYWNGAFLLDALQVEIYNYNGTQAAFPDFQPATSQPAVAMINGAECPSLEIAFGMVPSNGQLTKIKLLQNDSIFDIVIPKKQNILLNLNGHNADIEKYGFYNYGTFTITDSIGNGKMTVVEGNTSVLNNYGTLTVDGGEFTNVLALAEDQEKDYRRCIWTDKETTTHIKRGKFTSIGQVICNNGIMTIDDGVFECTGNNDAITNFATTDTLTINGGTFKNLTARSEGTNYRRAIWTITDSKTLIKGGVFKSNSTVICTNGRMNIENGEFECTGNSNVIANYGTTDTLVINGGTFKNLSTGNEQNNYRYTVWTKAGTATHITGGQFRCTYPVVISNGEMIIDNGTFETTGNTSAIYNYSTTGKMTINGGTFRNTLKVKNNPDYRRALYTPKETTTTITGGEFYSDFQVITTVGNIVIDNATIEDYGNGLGCLSAGKIVINNCKIKANRLLSIADEGTLKCYGGLYSQKVTSPFLGPSCQCVSNTDAATKTKYPYKVNNTANGIDAVKPASDTWAAHYDLNGMIRSDNNPGLHIIRQADGKTVKVLYK